MLELKPNTTKPMKHLFTTIIVAVLHMSTMCTTKSVVLGFTSDEEDDVSTSHMGYSDADSTVFSDSDSSVITALNETPSERHASVSRHSRRARRYPVDSEPESIYDSPHTTSYGRTPSHDKRGCFPYNHKNYDGDWEQDWYYDAEEDPGAPRPRRNEEYRGTRYSYNDRRHSPTPRERKDLRESKVPTCSDYKASASECRTPRERPYSPADRPRCSKGDTAGFSYLDWLPKELEDIILEKVGMRTLRSISNIDDKHRRIINDFIKAAVKSTHNSRGKYETFVDDPGSIMVQLIAAYGKKEVKHALMAHIYEQDLETVERWLKYAPRNLFLYGHRDKNKRQVSPICLASEFSLTTKKVRNSTGIDSLPFTDEQLWSDPAFALDAVRLNPLMLTFVRRQESIDDYYEIACKALKGIPWLFSEVKAEWLTEEQYCNTVSEMVGHTPSLLENVDIKKLSRSRQELLAITRKAIRKDPSLLFHAQDVLTALGCYYDMALDAVRHRPRAADHQDIFTLRYVASRGPLTRDQYYKIAYEAVRREPLALRDVDSEMLFEEQYYRIAYEAVRQDIRALQYVHPKLDRRDYSARMATFLRYWGTRSDHRDLENYYKTAMILVQNSPYLIHEVSTKDLACYYSVAMKAVERNYSLFKDIKLLPDERGIRGRRYPSHYTKYYKFCGEVIRTYPWALKEVKLSDHSSQSSEYDYKNLVQKRIDASPFNIRYVKVFGRNGKYHYTELAIRAVTDDFRCFEYIKEYIQGCVNKDVLTKEQYQDICTAYYKAAKKALKKDFRCFEYINKNVLTKEQYQDIRNACYEAAKKALKKNHRVFYDIEKNLIKKRVFTENQEYRLREIANLPQDKHSPRKET